MPDKHRGAVDFYFPEGAFGPLSTAEPLQLYRVFEREIPTHKSIKIAIPENMKLLLLCFSGEGTATVETASYSLFSDSLLFCPTGATECCVSCEKAMRCMCLLFDASAHSNMVDLTPLLSFFQTMTVACVKEAHLYRRSFSSFLSELSLPSPTMLLVKGYFYQALIAAYRQLSYSSSDVTSDTNGMNVVGQTVYAIIRYIDANLFSINNLADMAKELGYSYNYLSHLFRRKTGMTIQAYVTQKKIEQSTKLLVDEQYSVTEIAAMLNYDCIQSFSKAFRRAMQMSPTEYRALHLHEQ